MRTIVIEYVFRLPAGADERFRLEIDGRRLELVARPGDASPPPWARLDFCQCPICSLQVATQAYCPLMYALVPVVDRFEKIFSHDAVQLEVITDTRRILQTTTVQRGLSALMGLIMAVSGCPHTKFFKPMARFHLPLATEEETVYRAAATYLLSRFVTRPPGETGCGLDGLRRIYDNIHTVNLSVANRLRVATVSDASVNALVLLDMFTKSVPHVLDRALKDLRYLFEDGC